jgi:antigen flippase
VRDLVEASVVTWVGAVALMVAAVVRGKVFAVVLGPGGVGAMAQLVMFGNFVGVVGSMSLGVGIAQRIAACTGAGGAIERRRIVQTSLVATTLLGAALAIVVWLAAAPVAAFLLPDGGRSYAGDLRLFATGVVFLALAPNLQFVFAGFGAARWSSLTDVATALASVIGALLLVPLFGFVGAVALLVLTQVARVAVQIGTVRWRFPDCLRSFPDSADRVAFSATFPALVGIGVASMAMTGSDTLVQLLVRSLIVKLYGVAANGFYQAAAGASNQVLVMSMGFLTSYAFARVNAGATSQVRSERTNEAFHLSALVLIGGGSAVILLRELYVRVLLSSQFLPGTAYFAPQAAGEVLKQLGQAVSLGMLLTAGVKNWLFLGGVWVFSNAVFAALLLPLGPAMLPWPYAVSGLVYFATAWWMMARKDRLVISAHNLWLLVSGVALLALFAFAPASLPVRASCFVVLAGWVWFALGRYRRPAFEKVRGWLGEGP